MIWQYPGRKGKKVQGSLARRRDLTSMQNSKYTMERESFTAYPQFGAQNHKVFWQVEGVLLKWWHHLPSADLDSIYCIFWNLLECNMSTQCTKITAASCNSFSLLKNWQTFMNLCGNQSEAYSVCSPAVLSKRLLPEFSSFGKALLSMVALEEWQVTQSFFPFPPSFLEFKQTPIKVRESKAGRQEKTLCPKHEFSSREVRNPNTSALVTKHLWELDRW